jgi:imidazole glycerol-phosphate synthase subunit HisF
MLKKRVIPVLLLKDGRMVKGVRFSTYRETGMPRSAVRIYSAQDADELCFINLVRTPSGIQSLIDTLYEASEECFLPLTAGGGVKTINQIQSLFQAGADKVLLTSEAFRSPKLVTEASRRYGSQSVVTGIDYTETANGPVVSIDHGNTPLDVNICAYAKLLQQSGSGEIFLNCISRDGMMKGYDLNTSLMVASAVTIPVVTSGGAGNYQHLVDALALEGISGAACSSLFHFADNNPIRARSHLRNYGIPMRRLK